LYAPVPLCSLVNLAALRLNKIGAYVSGAKQVATDTEDREARSSRSSASYRSRRLSSRRVAGRDRDQGRSSGRRRPLACRAPYSSQMSAMVPPTLVIGAEEAVPAI
jgi:hypothetical protein